MAKRTISLQVLFARYIMIFALGSLGIWSLLWIYDEYQSFDSEAHALRESYLESQRTLLKTEMDDTVNYLKFMKNQTETRVRSTVRNRVGEAHAIAANLYNQYRQAKSSEEIKKLIRDALRPVRFNGGRGYYFAFDTDGIEELFADHPELEGTNMLGLQGGGGEFVVKDMLDIVRDQREGFYRYSWTKPEQIGKVFPKIAYVKIFEPLNWVIGTGEYLDDTESEIKAEVITRLVDLRYGTEGYFFASTFDGDPLFSNGIITKGTKNISELTDSNGVKVFQEQLKAAREGNGGFVSYSWPKLKGARPLPKISYVVSIPEWKWILGTGLYTDTIEKIITEKRQKLISDLENEITKALAVMSVIILLIFLWIRHMSRDVRDNLEALRLFFGKAVDGHARMETDRLSFDEFRAVAEWANVMVDGRWNAEQALRKSEKKYSDILDSMVDAVYSVDVGTFTLLQTNPAMIRIFGRSRQDFHDNPRLYLEMVHPDDRALAEKSARDIFDSREGECSYRIIRSDGQIRWILDRSRLILDDDGRPLRIDSQFTDITDRKDAEDALRAREKLLREIAANYPNSYMSIIDGDFNIAFTSGQEFKKRNIDPNLVIGKQIDQLFYPVGEKIKENYSRTFKGEEVAFELEVADQYLLMRGVPIFDEKGNIPQILGVAENITERRRMEMERDRLQAQLNQAQKMEAIGTLAGGIAHDFNNILAAIIGYTELSLMDIYEDHPINKYLHQILKAGERARSLVQQILSFSRRGRQQKAPIMLESIIKETLKLIRSTIPTTIDIKWNLDAGAGVVWADPTEIHQILMNLCANAAHAMRDRGGLLDIELRNLEIGARESAAYNELSPGPYQVLTVRDTGQGMDPWVVPRIFEPFFTTKGPGEGTGMGLAVVYGIVKSYRGGIKVESAIGVGTTFQVFLPVVPASTANMVDSVASEVPRGTGRILLVDDEPALATVGQAILERLGYRVISRTSSQEALETFQADPDAYDLLLTDQTMPRMTGTELAEACLKIRPDLPVILCTGYSQQITADMAREKGIRRFLMKPLVLSEVAQAVSDLLGGSITPPK